MNSGIGCLVYIVSSNVFDMKYLFVRLEFVCFLYFPFWSVRDDVIVHMYAENRQIKENVTSERSICLQRSSKNAMHARYAPYCPLPDWISRKHHPNLKHHRYLKY